MALLETPRLPGVKTGFVCRGFMLQVDFLRVVSRALSKLDAAAAAIGSNKSYQMSAIKQCIWPYASHVVKYIIFAGRQSYASVCK